LFIAIVCFGKVHTNSLWLRNSLTYLNTPLMTMQNGWVGTSALNSIASMFLKVRPYRWQPRCMKC